MSPYLADMAPHDNPPIPDPITITSYSPSFPDRPFPVPGYVGFSYFGSVDMSYWNVITLSRAVSSVCRTLAAFIESSASAGAVSASVSVL